MNSKVAPYIAISFIFCILTFSLIIKPEIDIYDDADEKRFHYPTILMFMDQFPNLDLVNYYSATTPLYHIILALSGLIVGPSIVRLRLINASISLVCLLTIYWYFSTRGGRAKGIVLSLIFLLSPYYIGPAIRLSTDNAALLFAVVSIFTMERDVFSFGNSIVTNLLILLTVATRQLYAWLIGAFLLFHLQKHCHDLFTKKRIKTVLPIFIPVSGLAFFIDLWHGLTPPSFIRHTAWRSNLDAPVYMISLVGLYCNFFCLWLVKSFREARREICFAGALIVMGLGYLLLHPISNEYDRITRGGSLWLASTHLPTILSSSVVFWILFPLGLVYLHLMLRTLVRRKEYLIIMCFFLWLMANMSSHKTMQKYYEPFTLFFIGYTVAPLRTERFVDWIGPILLIMGLLGVAILRFYH